MMMKIKAVGGAVLMVMILWFGAEAFAQTPSYPGANNEGGFNFGNHNDDGIPLLGGCNKKGDWCWEINIDPPFTPKRLPIEVYGRNARNLIAQGDITHAKMSNYGVFYLNVWSRYYHSEFDCDVNVSRRTYHCVENR
jgi:hypothetical protein